MANRTGIKAGHAYILIDALDKTDKVMGAIARRLDGLSQRFLFAGKQAAFLGVALTIPLTSAVNAAREYSDEILFLQSILGATAEEIDPLQKKIKELGATTSYQAKEVAQAATALAQGGFSQTKIIDSLEAVLDMARGARMELGPTANVLVDTLTLFQMEASEASRVADKFFIAAKDGTINVADLAQSFSYSALSARDMGFTLDETLAALSAMSLRMLKATKAGTSFNQMTESLANNADKLRELGIDPFTNAGDPKPMLSIITELALKLRKMNAEARSKALIDIFNVRGKRATGSLAMADAIEEISKNLDEMSSKIGIAHDSAKTMDSGIGGSIRRIASGFNLLKIEVGQSLAPSFKQLETNLLPVLSGMGKFIASNPQLVRDVAKSVGMIFAFSGVMTGLGISFRLAAISARLIGTVLRVLLLPIKILGGLARLLGNILKIVVLGLISFGKHMLLAVKSVALFGLSILKAIASLTKFAVVISFRAIVAVSKLTAQLLYYATVGVAKAAYATVDLAITIMSSLSRAFMAGAAGAIRLTTTLVSMGASAGGTVVQSLIALVGTLTNLGLGLASLTATLAPLSPIIGLALAIAALVVSVAALIVGFRTLRHWGGVLSKMSADISTSIVNIGYNLINLADVTIRMAVQVITNSWSHLLKFFVSQSQATMEAVKNIWGHLVFAFETSFGAIRKLIEAGEMEAAFQVVLRTLKFVWESTLLEMKLAWKRFATDGRILFAGLMMEISLAWNRFGGEFRTGVDDIVADLKIMTEAFVGAFSMIFDTLSAIARTLSPALSAAYEGISSLIGNLSTEAKSFFDELLRGRTIAQGMRELKRKNRTPAELAEEAAIVEKYLQAEIDAEAKFTADSEELARRRAEIRAQFEKDVAELSKRPVKEAEPAKVHDPETGLFTGGGDASMVGVPAKIREAGEDIQKTSTALPTALAKGTVEAAQQAWQNQQTKLLSSAAASLKVIEAAVQALALIAPKASRELKEGVAAAVGVGGFR